MIRRRSLDQDAASPSHRFPLRESALLLGVVLLAHGVTLFGDFVYDDRFIIVNNDFVSDPAAWSKFFTEGTWAGAGYDVRNYRPLPMLTFGLNHAIDGLRPFGYHLVNVLVHLVNVLLVYGLGRRLGWSAGAAWVAAAIFGVHPMHAEPVAEIVGRMDLLAATAFLGALVCHVTGRDRRQAGRRGTAWLASAVALYAVSLLCKEHVIVLPVLVLLFDAMWGVPRVMRSGSVYLGYATVGGLYLLLRAAVFGGVLSPHIDLLDNPIAQGSDWIRVVSALWVTGRYFIYFLLPVEISPDYSYAQILPFDSAISLGAIITTLCAIAVSAVGGWLVFRSRRAAMAIGLVLLPFLPVSNLFFPIGTVMGIRLFYLPVAGLALLIGLGWDRWGAARRRLGWGSVAIVLIVLTVLAIRHDLRWRNEYTLNSYGVEVAPRSARIRSNLGHELLERGELEAAAEQLRASDSIYPDWYLPVSGLAKVALKRGDLEEALSHARRALALSPDSVEALTLIAMTQRQMGEAVGARRTWERILEHDPANPSALSNLAIYSWQEGDHERALGLWNLAVQDPDVPDEVWLNMGRAYDLLGRPDEAEAAYRRFLSSESIDDRLRSEIQTRLQE